MLRHHLLLQGQHLLLYCRLPHHRAARSKSTNNVGARASQVTFAALQACGACQPTCGGHSVNLARRHTMPHAMPGLLHLCLPQQPRQHRRQGHHLCLRPHQHHLHLHQEQSVRRTNMLNVVEGAFQVTLAALQAPGACGWKPAMSLRGGGHCVSHVMRPQTLHALHHRPRLDHRLLHCLRPSSAHSSLQPGRAVWELHGFR